MKSNVIKDIFTAEDEAGKIIENGSKAADEIRAQAEKEAAALIRERVDEERKKTAASLAEAEKKLGEKLREIDAGAENLSKLTGEEEELVKKAASEAVDYIAKVRF